MVKKIEVLLLNFGVENRIQPWIDRDILYAMYTAEKIEEVEKFHKDCKFDIIFLKISEATKEDFYALDYLKNIYPRSKIIVVSEKPNFRDAFQYSKYGAHNFRTTFRDFFEFISFLRCSSQRAIVDNIKDKLMNVFRKDALLLLLMAITETALACLVKTKGEYETIDHMEGVAQYARLICEKLWEEKDDNEISSQGYIEYVYFGSRLHDIGKINISENITMKPYSLTKKEFDIVKTHTHYGHQMLSTIEQSMGYDLQEFIKVTKEIALHHHENYDGTGYPCGLKGKDIPLSARICALADIYDALTSDRRYRKSFSQKAARDIILHKQNYRYDPDILRIFRRYNKEFMEISSVFRKNAQTYSHKRMRVQCAWCKSLLAFGKWLPCNEVLYATHVMCPKCHKKLRQKINNINY
ncbi:MAG: HD domain-containing protein [candidate division WOR-3 bacterium]|nr:HD domain-containing protein [Elusimicrobiota bacterium]MDH5683315.1 HD domain-containing protein [candidate division WOR-3 bacterium]